LLKKRKIPKSNRYKFCKFIPCLTHHKNSINYEKTLGCLGGQLDDFLLNYNDLFRTKTSNCWSVLNEYVSGFIPSNKSNIESVSEDKHLEPYYRLQHFISDSPWKHRPILDRISKDAYQSMSEDKLIGILLDESGMPKKGKESVAVSHQYCGQNGKTENCQVGVYSALCQGDYSCLVDCSLYLPKSWTEDTKRCDKVDIPIEEREFKTKIELAYEQVMRQVSLGIEFDFVAFDALYGSSFDLADKLDKEHIFFVGDIRSNQQIFLDKPEWVIPPRKSIKGRAPSTPKPIEASIQVSKYKESLKIKDFKEITIRKTSKGLLKGRYHFRKVFVYNEEKQKVCERLLIIQVVMKGKRVVETKYALSNILGNEYSHREIAYMKALRYFVEHNFKEGKSTLGMGGFQTRKWLAWYHQMTLVLLLLLFIMKMKQLYAKVLPLLSANNIRSILASIANGDTAFIKALKTFFAKYKRKQKAVNYHYRPE